MNYNRGLMFVDQLERVIEVGSNRWKACCPAHDDRSPSLAIKQLDDGRVLLHCFAGCTAEEIVNSVGLTMSNLYPDTNDSYTPIRRKQNQKTVDSWILDLAAADRKSGKKLSKQDRDREFLAFQRTRGLAS